MPYIITNREHYPEAKDVSGAFSDNSFHHGDRGANELHCVFTDGNGWSKPTIKDAFVEVQGRMRNEKKNCLFFVHGWNNSWADVLKRAESFERRYGVICIVFSWPSGHDSFVLNDYRDRKRFARLSSSALDRALEKINDALKSTKPEDECGQSLTYMAHSMGNYITQGLFEQGHYAGETCVFDNVVLAAADVNSEGHEKWVNRLQCRGKVYITVNEGDYALRASRAKLGDLQKKRLGHDTQNLKAKAIYCDFTASIGRSHNHFDEDKLKPFWDAALSGSPAEKQLKEVIPNLFYRLD